MFYSYDKKRLSLEFKSIRLDAKISQGKASELSGVSKDTIRRIEKGEVIPRYDTLLALSQAYKRDLISIMRYISPSYEISNFYDEMDKLIVSYNVEKQTKLKERLEVLLKWVGSDCFANYEEIQQLLLITKVIKHYHCDNLEKASKMLKEALTMTNDDFDFSRVDQYRFTLIEKRLVLIYSVILAQKNNFLESNHILLYLLELFDQNSQLSQPELKLYLKIILNISYNYHRLSNNEKALEYADLGINIDLENDLFYLLPHLLFRKGIALYFQNHSNYVSYLNQCLQLLQITKQDKLYKLYLSSIKKNYGIDLFEYDQTN